jgi:23S rRNA pseudouridine1911/1915/1917 synthase
MDADANSEDEDDLPQATDGEVRLVEISAAQARVRLDKALAAAAPDLSRGRIQALLESGAISRDGAILSNASAKAAPGEYRLQIPAPTAAEPAPEDIPLDVLFEDDQLIVVNKPAGMAVHPAPGCETGTLVNALLFHCRGGLAGIGGVARPGIVHRIDKDTSGVMVAAKTDAAHAGLSALFAAHDIDRVYTALTRGAPKPARGDIVTQIGRSPHDRKKMAVLRSGGREAITHYRVEQAFGDPDRPAAAQVSCTLETGRTHQIRVHLASKGSPCLGDPVYGSGAPANQVRAAMEASGLERQALHAAVLGFRHPTTGALLKFEAPLPADMSDLKRALEDL